MRTLRFPILCSLLLTFLAVLIATSSTASAAGQAVATGRPWEGQCDVTGWTNVTTVSAGGFHTLGLRPDGTVVATGDNYFGQCNVTGWTSITAVVAGPAHSLGLRTDGSVMATGYNSEGQCNVTGWTGIVAIAAYSNHSLGLKADGTVVATGYNYYGQCDVSGWTGIIAISAGTYNSYGLKADGTVVAIGDNYYGQLAASNWTGITAISAGAYHMVGLHADGTVVTVGYNNTGQCDVTGWTGITAIDAGLYQTVGLRGDGTAVATGNNLEGQCDVSGWTNLTAINTGDYHTVALKSIPTYTVTPSAGLGGSIAPNTPQTVIAGNDITFTATPDTGYTVGSWSVGGVVAQTGGATFTLTNVNANASVSVSFTQLTYTVTPTSGANGAIAPTTAQTVNYGDGLSFTATPDSGYMVGDWSVDGVVTQTGGTTFALTNITGNHTVAVAFISLANCIITPSAGPGGSIAPSTPQTVAYNGSVTFTATPSLGNTVATWLVDGVVAQTGGATFTLSNITVDHAVRVMFKRQTFTITTQAGPGGTIQPSTVQVVNYNGNQSFTAKPARGNMVDQWLVDDVVVQTGGNKLKLSYITANHTVRVTFKSSQ